MRSVSLSIPSLEVFFCILVGQWERGVQYSQHGFISGHTGSPDRQTQPGIEPGHTQGWKKQKKQEQSKTKWPHYKHKQQTNKQVLKVPQDF